MSEIEQSKKKYLNSNTTKFKQDKDENNSFIVPLSRKMRWSVFITLISISILSDLDQGILSSTTSILLKDFKMTDRELGGLGGMIFLGTAIGCVFSFTLINKFNRKYLLLGTMSFDVLSLFLTTQTTNLALLYFCRVIVGFTVSFLNIYVPVWSDQFGIHKHKSIFLSIIHLSSNFGYLFGYVLGILMGWENSFYLENIIIIIHIVVIFMFLPDKYFSMNLMPLKAKFELYNKKETLNKKENQIEKDKKLIKDINDINLNINTFDDEEKNQNLTDNKNKEEEKKVILEEDNNSLFEDIKKKNQDISKESILSHIKVLIKSPIFILMNITLASMFIIVSAVQFWINDYLEYGLLIEDENKRLYAFAFVVITSPPAGIILGGILSGKVGGYDTEKAIYIPLITSFFVCIIANIAPLTSNVFIFLPFFWIYLFLGSVLLPVANGIILVSVDKKYAGSANSVSTLIYNILGRLPGPNLYAFFKSQINDKHSRIPFWLLLNMSIPGFIAVLICVKFQKQKYRNLKNLNLTEEEILMFDNKENENNNKKINKKDYKLEFKDIINDEN